MARTRPSPIPVASDDETERRLSVTEVRFKLLMQQAPVGIFVTDGAGDCQYVNERWMELAGMSQAQAAGKGWVDAVHPDDRQRVADEWYRAAREDREFRSEYRFLTPGGQVRWVQGRAHPLRDDAGDVSEYLGSVTDITVLELANQDRERARQIAEQHAARLMRLHALIGELAPATLPDEIAQLVVRHGATATGATSALLYRRDDDGWLRLMAQRGVPEPFLRDLSALSPDGGMPGALVAASGEPVWIEDFDAYRARFPALAARARAAGRAPAFAAVPLLADGQTLGVLAFGYGEAHRFDAGERAFIEMLAHHASHAFYRALLLQRAEAAARRAEEASRLKDEFLAMVSHELRTPLSAILGWISVLRTRRGHDPELVNKAVDVIGRNGEVQLRLIEDILDVSRIIQGKLRLSEEPIDIEPIAREVLDASRPAAAAKHIHMELRCAQPCRMLGDADRLRQIIYNLVTNAVKFTPEGGRVTLALHYDGRRLAIEVADTGCGIDPAFLPHVFDRFRQQDGSTSRAHSGLGLGLAIVKHLAEMHGGEVQASSEGIGKGTTITVRLPVRPFAPAMSTSGAELAGMKLLLVEDDPDAREMLGVLLRARGATVETAGSVEHALHALSGFAPEVVVTDIGLPGADGYELLAAIEQRCPGLPVVALTAFGLPSKPAQRFDAYLHKPVDPAHLFTTIARFRASRESSVPPS